MLGNFYPLHTDPVLHNALHSRQTDDIMI